MPTAHAKVVSTGPLHPDGAAIVEAVADLVCLADPPPAELHAALADADALIVRHKLPGDVFDHAPKLRCAVRHGVGLDFIPVDAATAAGVIVANLPDANTNAVVEHVTGMLFRIARRYECLEAALRVGDWEARHRAGAVELRGRTLGIVGLGRIGRGIAALAHHGIGMGVVGHDPVAAGVPDWIERAPLVEVFGRADIVSLHAPLTAGTRGMVGADLLARMPAHAWLINAARGELVDDTALVDALREKRIAGAALDVFDPEPLPADSLYRGLDNVILTPHTAALTAEAIRRMSVGAAEEVARVLAGEIPANFVNPEVRPRG